MIVSVVTSKDVGCYYSELWSPFVYESENKTQSVTIEVGFFCRCNCSFVIISILSFRQAIRPTVAAKPRCFRKDYRCFGPSAEQQKKSGRIMIIIGAIVLLLEVIVAVRLSSQE
mgnify:CR=1 FL=1